MGHSLTSRSAAYWPRRERANYQLELLVDIFPSDMNNRLSFVSFALISLHTWSTFSGKGDIFLDESYLGT